MSLSAGTRLGPYEIIAPIGAGGMGEVYRATDTRLGRSVAIKTSKQQFSERFEREARAVAALNHPNICQLYDVGPDYLVMELIEGPTLAEQIKDGPLPVEEALAIARQIAAALEAAHERGIVHRDLKPANVKLKSDGSSTNVKVLDFGLAKVMTTGSASGSGADAAHSPTLTIGMTTAGLVLGTASYMSPEQARGKDNVDKRADIWAFGVVLFEMLTGRRLFEGEDVGETLASVIKAEPKWDGVPANLRPLLERCLEKDPRKRLRDIGDLPLLLDTKTPNTTSSPPAARQSRWPWAAAALFAASTFALGFLLLERKSPPPADSIRFQISAPEKSTIEYVALSPDGRKLAFSADAADGKRSVFVRSMDGLNIQKLEGTEGSSVAVAWSPDSRYLAFGHQGKLKKIDVTGGPPESICNAPGIIGVAWSAQGTLLFSGRRGAGLFQVPVAGGDPVPVTVLDLAHQEGGQGWPAFLPDGRHFLYYRGFNSPEASGVYLGSLDSKPQEQESKRLLDASSNAVFAASDGSLGSILYIRGDALMARPFDAGRRSLSAEAVRLVDRVGTTGNYGGLFTVSNTGLLAVSMGGSPQRQLTWYDRQGKVLSHPGDLATRDEMNLSPDGTRVAEGRADAQGNWVVWLLDFARATNTRLTFDSAGAGNAVWSPDGSQVIYAPGGGSSTDLLRKSSSGAGAEQKIVHADAAMTPLDWSRDGRYLLYMIRNKETGDDLWVLPDPGQAAGNTKPVPYLVTPQSEGQARFSPDGRFVVYTSNESGISEIYVRPFPASAGGKWLISNGGGTQARWRADGKEILYFGSDSTLMSVEISTKPEFRAGVTKALFRVPITGGVGGAPSISWRWDISPDGQRFLVNTAPEDTSSTPVTIITNWAGLLKK